MKHISPSAKLIARYAHVMADYTLRTDGNNVDIDAEMANMAKNSIYYDALAQQMTRYFSGINQPLMKEKIVMRLFGAIDAAASNHSRKTPG